MKSGSGMDRRDFLKSLGAVGVLALPVFRPSLLFGADWPTKPIRLTIGYAVGGGSDIFARGFVLGMEGPLRTSFEVSNMAGSVAAVATDFVLKRPADGYAWLGTTNYNKFLRPMGYHKGVPWKDWQWFMIAGTYQTWAVKPDSPFKTFQDVLDASKKKPLTMSHSGIGGIWHEGDGIMAKAAGVQFNYIPYKGGAPAVLAGIQGEVDVVSSGLHEQIEFLRAGKLRNLALFVDKPMTLEGMTFEPVTKYIPSLKPHCPFGGDITMALRRDTPLEILKAVQQAYVTAYESPKYDAVLKQNVGYKVVLTPTESDKMAAFKECVTAWTFKDLGIAKNDPAELGIPKPEEFEKWWPPKDYQPRLT
ncbi:MAG: tripartite tricarboxylate transporter substrate binding protein [Syntrophales bacterium]|nr:tripartite tricarboxylate transporter substrate binding protein [Syntrophales bacterium]